MLDTPCVESKTLSQLTGARVFLKFENLQFTASFKERGACNKLSQLNAAERARGVIAMSAGNHAQGVAYHAQRLGIRAVIVMPVTTPQVKIDAVNGVLRENLTGIRVIRAFVRTEHEQERFAVANDDLTQTTLGVSRDDAGRFLAPYVEQGIYPRDPFVSLDIEGVGQLVRLAAERGRATRGDIKLGICGEHGGDPASIRFCESVGLDYVSASPYRVPIARLAAAQAALSASNR